MRPPARMLVWKESYLAENTNVQTLRFEPFCSFLAVCVTELRCLLLPLLVSQLNTIIVMTYYSRYPSMQAWLLSESGILSFIRVETHPLGMSRRVGSKFDVRKVVARRGRGYGRNGTWFANPHLRRWPKHSTADTSGCAQIAMTINELFITVNSCE